MSKNEIEKKKLKKLKKIWNQIGLIFETHDPSHETKITS